MRYKIDIVLKEEIEFLQSHSLFGGLKRDEIELLLPFLKKEELREGKVILEEGKVNDRLYFIYRGSVGIYKKPRGSKRTLKKISVLKTGDTFGEMELIDIQPCIASVKTLEPTTVLSISSMDLYKIAKKNLKTFTMIIMNVAREISRRLRRMDEIVSGESFADDFVVE